MEQDTIVMQDIYHFSRQGVDENGRAHGRFEATGVRPNFMDRLEAAGVRHRYHTPMVRALHLGPAPKEFVETSKAVSEGIEDALAAARPGNTAEDVEAAWRKSIARYSIEKSSRIGYSIGVGYPPDWGEHTVSLRPRHRTVLQENMALHMVCGIWDQDWGGVSFSEPFHITGKGAELFAQVPRELHVKQ